MPAVFRTLVPRKKLLNYILFLVNAQVSRDDAVRDVTEMVTSELAGWRPGDKRLSVEPAMNTRSGSTMLFPVPFWFRQRASGCTALGVTPYHGVLWYSFWRLQDDRDHRAATRTSGNGSGQGG